MDRIEQLMTLSDPANGLPAPGPLRLDASSTQNFTPIFTERVDDHGAGDREGSNVVWFKKPAVWIAGVAAAAAVAGVIIVHPFAPQQNQNTPAVSPTQSTQSSSGAPSSTEPASTSSVDQLPHGLVPAHPFVHWDDSAQCRAFDVTTVLVASAGSSSLEPFGGSAEDHPVIGCSGNYASYRNVSDRLAYEQPSDGFVGAFVAEWDGERWVQRENSPDSNTGDPLQLLPYPSLRISYGMEGQTPEEHTLEVLKSYGVAPENLEQLMGPNIPSWVSLSDATWEEFSNGEAGMAGEKRADWSIMNPAPIADSGRQEIYIFDAYGNKVASVMGPETDGPAECFNQDLTYRVVARSPLTNGLAASYDLALVTTTDTDGNERTNLRFLPQDQPVTGSGCDYPELIETPSGLWTAELGRFYGFASEDEISQFVDSQEWADLIRLANSLERTQ
ncbi:hypothetical protein [Neomicrococcus aestuarii]|uniref:Uncharacterized protein n=1 Tax=Neomicrococcus aestuarii TaxID=556325 RepID=A0A1L2ZLJ6_9MICC|nr:hypothetical protein [Neomicrococcus aestuarii]APF40263.1 hypothetical protein BHE16_03655 [Neomicrococcus aestuarii]